MFSSLFIANNVGRPTSLVLTGPSRYGKTAWARSLGSHIYWCGSTTIRDVDWAGASYLVCDDVPWEFFSGKKQLLGGQRDFILTEKYIRKTRITFGKPVIYLSNHDVRDDMTFDERTYYNVNVFYFTIVNKLF